MKRAWIPGFEGAYFATEDGLIFSCLSGEERAVFGQRSGKGYLAVTLCRDGERVRRSVHSLILEAFVGPRMKGFDASHRNGIPNDNRLDNLEWKPHFENMQDVRRQRGSFKAFGHPGEKHHAARMNWEAVKVIRYFAARGVGVRKLARLHKVSHSTISYIVAGRTWKEAQ